MAEFLDMADKTRAEIVAFEAVLHGPGDLATKKWVAAAVLRRRQFLASLLRQVTFTPAAEAEAPPDDPFAVFEVMPGGQP